MSVQQQTLATCLVLKPPAWHLLAMCEKYMLGDLQDFGALMAPVGQVALGTLCLIGHAEFLAWDYGTACQAMSLYQDIVRSLLKEHSGYLVGVAYRNMG
jgi:hypothetical protein